MTGRYRKKTKKPAFIPGLPKEEIRGGAVNGKGEVWILFLERQGGKSPKSILNFVFGKKGKGRQ